MTRLAEEAFTDPVCGFSVSRSSVREQSKSPPGKAKRGQCVSVCMCVFVCVFMCACVSAYVCLMTLSAL